MLEFIDVEKERTPLSSCNLLACYRHLMEFRNEEAPKEMGVLFAKESF